MDSNSRSRSRKQVLWPWGARQTSEQEMRAVATQSDVDLLIFEAAGPEERHSAQNVANTAMRRR
jgi:hypothetical protein